MNDIPTSRPPVEVWMLVNFEPGFEDFEIGDRVTPTTIWITADAIPGGVPDSLLTTVAGHVEPDPNSQNYGWMHLGRRFPASLPAWTGQPGPTRAEGLLLYDRYSWIKGPPREGAAVVLERTTLARPVTPLPTGYENWSIPQFHGCNILNRERTAPEGTFIEWRCIRIGIDPFCG